MIQLNISEGKIFKKKNAYQHDVSLNEKEMKKFEQFSFPWEKSTNRIIRFGSPK